MISGMRLLANRLNMARIVIRFEYVFSQAIFLMYVAGENTVTDLRLTGGPSPYEGTVEYRINNGNWETTCGVNLGINDAIVVCKHLNYTGANRAIPDSPFNVSDDTPSSFLICDGGEADVSQCLISSTPSCTGAGAAVCYDNSYQGCFKDMRNDRVLPGNPCPDGGQQGSTVCISPDLTIRKCINMCSSVNDTAYVYAGVGNGEECFCGITGTDYSRHGRASDNQCHTTCHGNMYESCGGIEHIAVFKIDSGTSTLSTEMTFQPSSFITTSESVGSSNSITNLRLTGGPSPYEGTVEYRINNGNWETTCGVNLGINDAIVVCKHLNYTGANRAIPDSPFNVSDDTPSSYLFCDGEEADVSQCMIISTTSCTGAGAAVCYGKQDKSYQGCFQDMTTDRVLPGNPCQNGGQQSSTLCVSSDLTIRKCINMCSSVNDTAYVYAGVENGEECFCGLPSTNYSRHGRASDNQCHNACSGNMYESCGGTNHIAVFKFYPGGSTLSTEMSVQPLSSITTSESVAPWTSTTGSPGTSTMSTEMSVQPLSTITTSESRASWTSFSGAVVSLGVLFTLVTVYAVIVTIC